MSTTDSVGADRGVDGLIDLGPVKEEVQKLNEQLLKVEKLLQDKYRLVEQDLTKQYQRLREDRARLKTEQINFKKEKRKIDKIRQISKSKIKLNVGGKLFVTSISTLTKEKDSFFSAMFSGRYNLKPDDDGDFFIDRNPRYFEHILDFLRTGVAFLPTDRDEKHKLLLETEFYQISSLSQLISKQLEQETLEVQDDRIVWNSELCGRQLTLSDGNKTVEANPDITGYRVVLACMGYTSGKHRWNIHVSGTNKDIHWTCIGVATQDVRLEGNYNDGIYSCSCASQRYDTSDISGRDNRGFRYCYGDTITCELDCDLWLLKYYLNGTETGVACKLKPDGKYYPCAVLRYPGNQLRISGA